MKHNAPKNPLLSPFPAPGPEAMAGMPYGTILPYAGSIDRSGNSAGYGGGYGWRDSGNPGLFSNFGPGILNNTGWIVCDGCQVPVSLFPGLFDAIGFTYGGSLDLWVFHVPDYRGSFFRGVAVDSQQDPGLADPPAAEDTRQSPSEFGQKNGVGSIQPGDVQMHKHDYDHYPCKTPKVPSAPPPPPPEVGTSKKETVKTFNLYSADDDSLAGNETRPKNIYVNYLIFSGLPSHSPFTR